MPANAPLIADYAEFTARCVETLSEDVARGAAQDPGTLLWLRGLFAWGPVAALALSWGLIRRYPLDEAAMNTVRRRLAGRISSDSSAPSS